MLQTTNTTNTQKQTNIQLGDWGKILTTYDA